MQRWLTRENRYMQRWLVDHLPNDEGVRPLALHELLNQKRIPPARARRRAAACSPIYCRCSSDHPQVLRFISVTREERDGKAVQTLVHL